jgi:hypothetical protein
LKNLKKDLEAFYKGIIKVLFSGAVNNEVAVTLERQANLLIMSVNDHIDEIEIRLTKEA